LHRLHSQLPRGPFEPRRTGSNLFLQDQPALLLFRIRQFAPESLGFISKSQGCEVLNARINETASEQQSGEQQQ
jgi:hypothetical protein